MSCNGDDGNTYREFSIEYVFSIFVPIDFNSNVALMFIKSHRLVKKGHYAVSFCYKISQPSVKKITNMIIFVKKGTT